MKSWSHPFLPTTFTDRFSISHWRYTQGHWCPRPVTDLSHLSFDFCFFCGVSFTSFRHLSIATVMKAEPFYSLHVLLVLRHNKPPQKNNQERNWITCLFFFEIFTLKSRKVWLVEPSNGCSKYWMATSWSTRPFHNSRPLSHILVPVFSFLL